MIASPSTVPTMIRLLSGLNITPSGPNAAASNGFPTGSTVRLLPVFESQIRAVPSQLLVTTQFPKIR
jgi:hypothetical protein